MEETEQREQQGKKNLDELIDEQGGAAALRRRTGISDLTIRKIRRGERMPFVGTAARMSEGLGVDISEIDWPRGYATSPGEKPKVSLDDLSPDTELFAAIKDLIQREVEKQMARPGVQVTAAQSQGTEGN